MGLSHPPLHEPTPSLEVHSRGLQLQVLWGKLRGRDGSKGARGWGRGGAHQELGLISFHIQLGGKFLKVGTFSDTFSMLKGVTFTETLATVFTLVWIVPCMKLVLRRVAETLATVHDWYAYAWYANIRFGHLHKDWLAGNWHLEYWNLPLGNWHLQYLLEAILRTILSKLACRGRGLDCVVSVVVYSIS